MSFCNAAIGCNMLVSPEPLCPASTPLNHHIGAKAGIPHTRQVRTRTQYYSYLACQSVGRLARSEKTDLPLLKDDKSISCPLTKHHPSSQLVRNATWKYLLFSIRGKHRQKSKTTSENNWVGCRFSVRPSSRVLAKDNNDRKPIHNEIEIFDNAASRLIAPHHICPARGLIRCCRPIGRD